MFKPIMATSMTLIMLGYWPLSAGATTLKAGTPIKIRLEQTIDSKNSHVGDVVRFSVVTDVIDPESKAVLVKAGSQALGSISEAEKAGHAGKKGELALTLSTAQAVDGSPVPLEASLSRDGKSKRGTSIALGTVGAVLFLPLAFFFLKKGKQATIPAGSELMAYSATPVEVKTGVDQKAGPTSSGDSLDRLERLNKLFQDGALTQEEFDTQKQKLLQD